MNWTNNSLFNFVKKVLKELKIPFNDPCDTSYIGDCICGSGSSNVTTSNITSQTPFTNPPTSPNEGDEFINTIDSTQWIHNGTTWIARPASAGSPKVNYTFLPTTNIPAVTAIVPPTIPSPLLTGSIEIVKYFNGETIWQYNGATWDFMSIDYTNGPIINP